MPVPTRKDDERLLTVLRLREEGRSFTEIGKAVDRTRSAVSGMLTRFNRDDTATKEA